MKEDFPFEGWLFEGEERNEEQAADDELVSISSEAAASDLKSLDVTTVHGLTELIKKVLANQKTSQETAQHRCHT